MQKSSADVHVWQVALLYMVIQGPRLLLPCGPCFFKVFSSHWQMENKERGRHICFLSTQTQKGHSSLLTTFHSWILIVQSHLDGRYLWHQCWLGSHFPAISWHCEEGAWVWGGQLAVDALTVFQPLPELPVNAVAHIQDDCPWDTAPFFPVTVPIFLDVPQVAFLQMLHSVLKADVELG